MENKSDIRPTPQLIFGLSVIILGVLFTLDNLDIIIFPAKEVFRFWPLLLMALGLGKLLESNRPSSLIAGTLFFGVGSLLLLRNLNVIRFHLWSLWPLFLVAIGGGILWQALTREKSGSSDPGSYITAIAVLSGVDRTFNSRDFRGGDLTAIMGGCEIDLRDASILQDQAVLNVFAMWGGIEIRVPEDWSIAVRGFPFLGGFDDSTRLRKNMDASPSTMNDSTKQLVIKGIVIMGGVEIKN